MAPSSTPTYRKNSTLGIRSRSNTDSCQNTQILGINNDRDENKLSITRSTSPSYSHHRTVSPVAAELNTSSSIPMNLNNSNNSNITNNTNNNGNDISTPSKRTSVSVPNSTSKVRSHSFLSQLTNHMRQLSTDVPLPSIDSNGNTVSDTVSRKLSVSSFTNPNTNLNSPFQKGKHSPENSPILSGSSMASPVRVSGVAAGPDASNLILEVSDEFDIDELLHSKEHIQNIPKLTPSESTKDKKPLFIKTDIANNSSNHDTNINGSGSQSESGNSGSSEDDFDIPNQNNDDVSLFLNQSDYFNNSGFFSRLYLNYPHLNITITSILFWYFFSMSISVYNRWMFSSENLDFKYPILITSFHQLILTILAILTLILFPSFRLSTIDYRNLPNKEDTNSSNEDITESDEQLNNEPVTYTMPIKEYLTKILPCSIASAGDIGLGNTAFRFITLSLYTMVKTSALIFVLLWGVFFKLEKLTLRIITIVCIMTFGVSMMVWGQHDGTTTPTSTSTTTPSDMSNSITNGDLLPDSNTMSSDNFNEGTDKLMKRIFNGIRAAGDLKGSHIIFIGVSLVLLSACMSGLRWALTQIMLKKNKRTKNPILTMLYISPGMCVFLFLVGAIVEGVGNFLDADIWEIKGVSMTIILILIPGFLAFFMTLSEYVLLQYASLLTLSIAGIFKELLTIFVSWVVFGDKLSFINIIGLTITFADIIWYNIYRFQQNEEMIKNNTNEFGGIGETLDNEFVDIEMNNITVK